MNGLNFISYTPTQTNIYTYNVLIEMFNGTMTNTILKSGIITALQLDVDNDDDIAPSNPPVTTFTNDAFGQRFAVKFYGYFRPPTTGDWKFNIGITTGKPPDDMAALFIGPPDSTIVPASTYTTLATSPSNIHPVVFNTYTNNFTNNSSPISLTAGEIYPILYYFSQTQGGYKLGLSFSSPSYNDNAAVTDFTNLNYTSSRIAPCFKEGTKILTNNGYIPIEELKKGDLIKTLLHDFKAIDIIGKKDIYHYVQKERIKDQLYKCSNEQYPEIFEDLIITGSHSILVDNFINEEQKQKTIEINKKIYVTDQKYRLPACNDPRAIVYSVPGTYTVYHLALENDNYYMNYGIYANGLLVETCSKRYLKEHSNMTLIE